MKCVDLLKSNLLSLLNCGVFRRSEAPKYRASSASRKEKRYYPKLLWR